MATEKDLQGLAGKLESATEFAVDLEHHSYRSFQGFTCLMQVSTRTGTSLASSCSFVAFVLACIDVFTCLRVYDGRWQRTLSSTR